MNFILTASAILFPLITFPYISRVLLVEGNGKIAFATSIITYFMMFSALGIPTYGIRACAKVRDDKERLSKVVQELIIINTITTAIVYSVFLVLLFLIPKFIEERELLLIVSIGMILNIFGVNWFYNALEQYAYITVRSIAFKVISIIMMFLLVKNPSDYLIYAVINVFAGSGSNVLNFIHLRRFVSLKKTQRYDFKVHLKPIFVFFAMSVAISIYTNLDVVMLGFMKNDIEVGYYNAAIKVKTLLVSLITSLGTVLLPRLSYYLAKGNQKEFHRIIAKAINFVIITGVALVIYFLVFAKESILFLAGKGFEGAILPMQFLMPTVLFIGISNVTGIQMLTPMGREKKVLVSIVVGAVVDFLLNLWLIPAIGATGAALATMVAELLVVVVQAYYLKEILGEIIKNMSIPHVLVAGAVASVVGGGIKLIGIQSSFIVLCISAVLFFGVYGVILLLLKEPFICDMISSGRKVFRQK